MNATHAEMALARLPAVNGRDDEAFDHRSARMRRGGSFTTENGFIEVHTSTAAIASLIRMAARRAVAGRSRESIFQSHG
jgi:hypothetical protein